MKVKIKADDKGRYAQFAGGVKHYFDNTDPAARNLAVLLAQNGEPPLPAEWIPVYDRQGKLAIRHRDGGVPLNIQSGPTLHIASTQRVLLAALERTKANAD